MKAEFSKIISIIIICVGIGTIAAYYAAIFKGLECDSAVAVSGIAEILGVALVYCLYQYGLKNSRNKNGIDADGVPYAVKQKYEEKFGDEEE